ncbi:MAG: hypothetical protein QM813_08760 [Verrucomicrobiota bacterium]
MKYSIRLIYLVLGLGASTAFAEVDLSKLPAASTQQDITYTKDIKPLFEASCFRCHGEKEKKAGLRLDSLEAVLKGSKEGKIVEAGNALKSPLLISVSCLDPETAMPPKPRARKPGQGSPGGPGGPGGEHREGGTNAPASGGPRPGGPGGAGGNFTPAKPLTPEQVGLVRAWIDQGAK